MPFQPTPHQTITISGVSYRFSEHPAIPGLPYGQEGRQAVVYQLISAGGDKKALKVFKATFRTPAMVSLAEQIGGYASQPGLQVCSRVVLTPQIHLELLREHPDLIYAVLMPWVEGPTWTEKLLEGDPFTPEQSLALARELARLLVNLEQKNLAHCDLSGSNIILTDEDTLEFVDIEGLYAPNLIRPEVLPAGSPGYAHQSAPEGLWSTRADRFAGVILLAEILGWCDDEVRQTAWGESFFDPKEVQTECERYQLLSFRLQNRWGAAIAALFERAWNSITLSQCPTFGEWLVALPSEVPVLEPDRHEEAEKPTTVVPLTEPSQAQPTWVCSACNAHVDYQREVCPYCEKGFRPQRNAPVQIWYCDVCGKQFAGELEICPYCKGEPTESEVTSRPALKWVSIGMISILIIILGTLVILGKGGQGPLAMLITLTRTPTPTRSETSSATITLTPSLTNTTVHSPTSTPSYEPTELPARITDDFGVSMALIPAGSFLMGRKDGTSDENLIHTVELDNFYIDQYEVTNFDYKKCVDANFCISPPGSHYRNIRFYNHPVVFVDWYDAQTFCEWRGARLPTEAEWEKAARGGVEAKLYSWGDEPADCTLANFAECVGDTSPVGSYVPNGYNLYDMGGNVWESVADWYDPDYYSVSPEKNPQGPDDGIYKILRGGSWMREISKLLVAQRESYPGHASGPYGDIGFRCANDVPVNPTVTESPEVLTPIATKTPAPSDSSTLDSTKIILSTVKIFIQNQFSKPIRFFFGYTWKSNLNSVYIDISPGKTRSSSIEPRRTPTGV